MTRSFQVYSNFELIYKLIEVSGSIDKFVETFEEKFKEKIWWSTWSYLLKIDEDIIFKYGKDIDQLDWNYIYDENKEWFIKNRKKLFEKFGLLMMNDSVLSIEQATWFIVSKHNDTILKNNVNVLELLKFADSLEQFSDFIKMKPATSFKNDLFVIWRNIN
jgi:hypothetical protein